MNVANLSMSRIVEQLTWHVIDQSIPSKESILLAMGEPVMLGLAAKMRV